jgi:hypothetical protein
MAWLLYPGMAKCRLWSHGAFLKILISVEVCVADLWDDEHGSDRFDRFHWKFTVLMTELVTNTAHIELLLADAAWKKMRFISRDTTPKHNVRGFFFEQTPPLSPKRLFC